MSIPSNLPQIVALRQKVEERFGKPLVVHADFVALTDKIEAASHEYISPSTLERVWGYSTRGYDTVSLRTLDVLAQYACACYWEDFCEDLRATAGVESELFSAEVINASDLNVGDELMIGWLPNRVCRMRYEGNNSFTATACENATMRPGDTFTASQFVFGQELIMTNFKTPDCPTPRNYAVGQQHGLTLLKVVACKAESPQ